MIRVSGARKLLPFSPKIKTVHKEVAPKAMQRKIDKKIDQGLHLFSKFALRTQTTIRFLRRKRKAHPNAKKKIVPKAEDTHIINARNISIPASKNANKISLQA